MGQASALCCKKEQVTKDIERKISQEIVEAVTSDEAREFKRKLSKIILI